MAVVTKNCYYSYTANFILFLLYYVLQQFRLTISWDISLLSLPIHFALSGVTVLLSLTVFQQSISDAMPVTSLQIPLLGNKLYGLDWFEWSRVRTRQNQQPFDRLQIEQFDSYSWVWKMFTYYALYTYVLQILLR